MTLVQRLRRRWNITLWMQAGQIVRLTMQIARLQEENQLLRQALVDIRREEKPRLSTSYYTAMGVLHRLNSDL